MFDITNHICIADSVIKTRAMSELRSYVVEAMIDGYEYQSIWEAEVGENLTCIREPGNIRDSTFLVQGASLV